VEALLRRARQGVAEPGTDGGVDIVSYGPVRADLSSHEVVSEGNPVKLTLTEFRLLVALLRGRGKVLSREDLMYTAMGPDVVVTSRTIDVHMAAIRRKLGGAGGMIRTIRGVGYLVDERCVGVAGEDPV